MMPKTSVRPAAIRNSMTPNCSPLRHCSTTSSALTGTSGNERGAGGPAPLARPRRPALPLHRALLVIGVLVVLVVGELAARRLEVGLAHGGHHAAAVREVTLHRPYRRIDEQHAVVALGP